jgi:hypothetical protein
VCSCLKKLKNNFDAMIIITHIQELRAYMDMNMSVSKQTNGSQLQFGKLADHEMRLEINNEAIKIKGQIDMAKIKVDTGVDNTGANDTGLENQSILEFYNIDAAKLDRSGLLQKNSQDTYTCSVCNKEFKKLDAMKTHLKSKSYKSKHSKLFK